MFPSSEDFAFAFLTHHARIVSPVRIIRPKPGYREVTFLLEVLGETYGIRFLDDEAYGTWERRVAYMAGDGIVEVAA